MLWILLAAAGLRPAAAAEPSTAWRSQALKQASRWMFQIADLDAPGAVDALAASSYPMLVVDPGDDLSPPYDTKTMVRRLSRLPGGGRRLLLAYVDIGDASDERTYWKDYWRAPTRNFHGYPEFLLRLARPGDGLYPVAYWDQAWRRLWLGPEGRVAALARQGFDGVVLDGAEAYDDDAVRQAAAHDGVDPGQAMIALLSQARQDGRRASPGFLTLVQNGLYLVDEDPQAYAKAVDGVVVEDTFFRGLDGSAWDSSTAGDRSTARDGDGWSTRDRLAQYRWFLALGLPVFSVDYCVDPAHAALVYAAAAKAGLRPLVTRHPLSRLTETPPPAPAAGVAESAKGT